MKHAAGLAREAQARAAGRWPLAGVDEAGRGPLAGPVVTAAVILDPDNVPEGLADSKLLTAARREELFARILASAHVAIATASALEIDTINIRAATLAAMARAVAGLPMRPALVLVDGRDTIRSACPCEAVIGGDALVASIAAASIVAKVMRDRMMVKLDAVFPQYGFAGHKGYGAATHLEAIARHGPCQAHRFSFSPIRGNWERASLTDS